MTKKQKKTILIVDDDFTLQTLLQVELVERGYKVILAEDGLEGLKLAKSEHPDLILLDIMMPKMDGMQVLSELRKDSWGGTVKVIILTRLDDAKKTAIAIEEGAYDYLLKDNWEVKDVVDKVVEKIGVI